MEWECGLCHKIKEVRFDISSFMKTPDWVKEADRKWDELHPQE
jgi:hypothetical protein